MARRDPVGRRRSVEPAGGYLFILFNYEMYVSDVPQAIHAAWANIWGIHRVHGTPSLCLNLLSCLLLDVFGPLHFFLLELPVDRRMRRIAESWPRGIIR